MRALLWLGAALLPIFLGGALVQPARAGEEERVNVRELKAQIERLEHEKLKLREAGHGEEAAAIHRRIKEMRRHLEEYLALRERRGSDRPDAKRKQAILRGLGQGIEALEALGRKKEAVHLRKIREELKRAQAHARPKKDAPSEREIVEGWIELMGYAVKVLVKAGSDDRAELIEHGKHAFELALAGKKDERSMKIRKGAPARATLAECLLHAAEILQEHGDERHAKLMADLGRHWKMQARERDQREGPKVERPDLEDLETRIRILKSALPALREGERPELVAIVERALRTGRVLLAEREDDEAREILEQTPPLLEIAGALLAAAPLWTRFGDEAKARLVRSLGMYYLRRVRAEREEEREREEREGRDAEEGHREDGAQAEELERLQGEMRELRAALERMQRQLRALLRDK
jgi:hypothetical protein